MGSKILVKDSFPVLWNRILNANELQSTLDMSNTAVSKYPLMSKNKVKAFRIFN